MGRPPIRRNVDDSRRRLLNSLGLFQEQQQRDELRLGRVSLSRREGRDGSPSNSNMFSDHGKKKIRHVRSHSDIPARSALHNTVAFETRLNDESVRRGPKDSWSSKLRRSSFSDKDDTNSATSSVRFNTVVSGVKIPSRNQYSSRIKQTLWRDRYELSEMVERNTMEFHAENYDWKQVVLDEEMYVDATSGEKVHPCHVEGSCFDDDECDIDLEFAPLSRSDSIVGEKSS